MSALEGEPHVPEVCRLARDWAKVAASLDGRYLERRVRHALLGQPQHAGHGSLLQGLQARPGQEPPALYGVPLHNEHGSWLDGEESELKTLTH